MNLVHSVSTLGRGFITLITGLGAFARLLGAILARSSILWRRPRLTAQQVHFIGNHSLLIIGVSGLFVGFVLGLQGYYTLNRYGSEEALGLLVA
ncbi:MAG TPA: ABC transporter permease, partial [Castellaniella sp.]|uniref:ABC transporter permease n=1 Tax=Castellaniella sp. TaxID=1955812 RepID=UPI002EFD28F9